MSTFSAWFTGLKKSPAPRQITWVCGNEVVLVEDVVRYVLEYLGPEPWNLATFVAGEDSERSVWAALDQHPLGSGSKVVVIRHAEKLTDWDRFQAWIKQRRFNPRTYVVLVSAEEHVPKVEPTAEQRRHGAKSEPAPHIAAIGAKGHVIECRPFTSATALKSVAWVQSKVRIRETVAKHLLERANWDLRLVRDVCLKLAVFPGDITIPVVNTLMTERPRDTFTDALLALDRKTALLALAELSTEDIGRTIGQLDAKLDLAGTIHDLQVEHRPPGEMARALGAQAFLLKEMMAVAKHYDAKRRLAVRKVLAIADEAYRSGQTVGVLEAVVAFW